MQVNCAKCGRPIALTHVIESSAGRLSHLDCARAEGLTPEERALLFIYCSGHVAAKCVPCGLEFRMIQLAADPLGGRTNLCPRCRTDLTASVRAHLFGCATLPEEIRQRTQEVRDAAQMLVKRSQEVVDRSDILVREAETNLFERQGALRAAMASRSST
jgi:DNA-directed RNA polymerase subunit RPC12/RpoP